MSYTLICDHSMDTRNCREGYVDAMYELMKEDPRIIHIDCDLLGCVGGGKLKDAYPDRVINAGIAEANAAAMAAGLKATGMIPFLHTFGVFAGRRIFDQIFISSAYSDLGIHVIGTDPGVTAGVNGATHMPFEDAGLYLEIPGAVVLDPCDYSQVNDLVKQLAKDDRLSYLRLIRRGFKPVYADGSSFTIGKALTLTEGRDAAIICSGIMVNNALEAKEKLEKEGVHVRVIDMFTWKPLDEETIVKAAKECGCIVTAENHLVSCGLGSAVANVLTRKCPVPQEFIGIQDRFGQTALQEVLEKEYEMTSDDIVAAVNKAMKRKR